MTLTEARLDAGLTQAQVCEILEIPMRTWQSWEQGKRECPQWCKRLLLKELAEIKQNKSD